MLEDCFTWCVTQFGGGSIEYVRELGIFFSVGHEIFVIRKNVLQFATTQYATVPQIRNTFLDWNFPTRKVSSFYLKSVETSTFNVKDLMSNYDFQRGVNEELFEKMTTFFLN